jgi:hypothetical protein
MRAALLLVLLISAQANAADLAVPNVRTNLLLDARCEAAEWSKAARLDLGAGATLLAQQDAQNVYLCLQGPRTGGMNTTDLFVVTPRVTTPLDLHVSAQVGERSLTAQGWPDWQWRNHAGWHGAVVPFAGVKSVDGRNVPDFAPDTDREFQLSKTRFGALPWRVRVELRALGSDRKGSVVFPDGTSAENADGWLVLKSARP